MSKAKNTVVPPVPRPISREEALEKLKRVPEFEEVPGLGLVEFHQLTFEEQYIVQAFSSDNIEYAARIILAGIDQPKFLEADIPALKGGKFGPIGRLAALPVREVSKKVSVAELGKPLKDSKMT